MFTGVKLPPDTEIFQFNSQSSRKAQKRPHTHTHSIDVSLTPSPQSNLKQQRQFESPISISNTNKKSRTVDEGVLLSRTTVSSRTKNLFETKWKFFAIFYF